MKKTGLQNTIRLTAIVTTFVMLALGPIAQKPTLAAGSNLSKIFSATEKVVKIDGAGGYHRLEPYQTGITISPDGQILTLFSYVLDCDNLRITLGDGREFEAQIIGVDPGRELAVLKIDAENLPYFEINRAVDLAAGSRIYALSNLFGIADGAEPVSVQRGIIAAKTELKTGRGIFKSNFDMPVYLLDTITNNPGAGGGAIISTDGQMVAIIGKELQADQTGTWLNIALGITDISETIDRLRAGEKINATEEKNPIKPENRLTNRLLGLELIPNLLDRTPPYIDRILKSTPATNAGLRPDDLILLLDDHLIQTINDWQDELKNHESTEPISITVDRGGKLIKMKIAPIKP
jgi:serine protease Do